MSFGVLVLTTVTTTRKIFSTVYSVFRNPNQTLTNIQWTGCFIVFAFLGMETAEKVHRNRNINAATRPSEARVKQLRIIVRERERERERDRERIIILTTITILIIPFV